MKKLNSDGEIKDRYAVYSVVPLNKIAVLCKKVSTYLKLNLFSNIAI